MYKEPTNENKPYRPYLGKPLTRDQLVKRLELARDSHMLGVMSDSGLTDKELIT